MAKIVGGTTATPMRVPDWEQTNPLKADYIKNKPFIPEINDGAVSSDLWTSKNIIDSLCVGFEKSGSIVNCYPFPGYPLEVETAGATITRCGKNLWNFKAGVQKVTATTNKDGDRIEYWGHRLILPPGKYTLHADRVSGTTARYIYGDINGADGAHKGDVNIVTGATAASKTITITEGDVLYIYNGNTSSTENGSNNIFKEYNVQIEAGAAVTDYEEYRGGVFPAGETIPALNGYNTLWADSGAITVRGKEDLVHIIQALRNS